MGQKQQRALPSPQQMGCAILSEKAPLFPVSGSAGTREKPVLDLLVNNLHPISSRVIFPEEPYTFALPSLDVPVMERTLARARWIFSPTAIGLFITRC